MDMIKTEYPQPEIKVQEDMKPLQQAAMAQSEIVRRMVQCADCV